MQALILSSYLAASILIGAEKTHIFGDIVLSYSNFQQTNSNAPRVSLDTTSFSFDQADIGVLHYFNDWTTGYFRMTAAGTSTSISEAYIKREGLPLNGSITIGKFYKPLGSAIPLANLSFPSLIFHAHPDIGIKGNFSKYPWNIELGYVNGNPLATANTSSVRIGGSPVISNTHTSLLDSNKEKEVYGRFAYSAGEDWGSLTVGVTGHYSELGASEVNALNPATGAPFSFIGAYQNFDRSDVRRMISGDLDYQRGPGRIFGEFVHSEDGRLRRQAWSMAGSYTFDTKFGEITPTAAYDAYDMNAGSLQSLNARTWDRSRASGSIAWWPLETIQVIGEYSRNQENARNTDGRKVQNNEYTVQTVYYF